MSCVPSINAYVATHACHQDEPEKPQVSPIHTVNEPEKVKKSWLGSIMDRFTIIGHDGVGFTSQDFKIPATQENNVPAIDKTDTKFEQMKILSRVRHLSNSSTTSTDGSTSPLPTFEPLERSRHNSNPER